MRQILDNTDMDITSFDYNYETRVFYLADAKNKKVLKKTKKLQFNF